MREQVAGADLLARLQVAVEGDRPAAPLDEREGVPLEGEVEAGVHLVPLEPGVEDLRVAPPDLAEEEEALPDLVARPLAVLGPEVVGDVLDGVEAEAVDAEPLRPGDLGVEEVLRDLGVLGLEVGEAGDARREVVRAAVPLLVRPEPPLRLRVLRVLRLVAGVVVDDVEQDADAARVGGGDEGLEVVFGPEARVEREEVVGPVAVVGPVGETRPGDEARRVP